MWSGQLARSEPSSAVANGFLQRQKEAVEKKKEQKRTQIRADLEKEREALDERVRQLRARPHAQLFKLDDEVAMGMARRLIQEEDRVRLAEERINLVQQKKTEQLKYTKLNEWLDKDKKGGLEAMQKLQKNLKKQLESGDDRLAQALIQEGKAIAVKNQQTSLLLFKAAAFYYSATGQERPKLTERIEEMESAVARLTEAGMLNAGERVVLNEGDEDGGAVDSEAQLAAQQAILASDSRSALQMAKDKWQPLKGGWKGRTPEQKKQEIEKFQQQIKEAISATAKRICIEEMTQERWDAATEQERQERLRNAEAQVDDRRRKAAGDAKTSAGDATARISTSASGKKKDGARMVNGILAHHAKLRSILDEIKADGFFREEIEKKACSNLLECDEAYLKLQLMTITNAHSQVGKLLKDVEAAAAENDAEAEALDQKLDSSIKKLWMRFVSKHHPDKAGGQYADDYTGWEKVEKAAGVLRDRRVRLLYFTDVANVTVTVETPVHA